MIYFDVYVRDRITAEEVCVGSLLAKSEALELMRILEKYNATDLYIYKMEVSTK